jgi:hypothetical protein
LAINWPQFAQLHLKSVYSTVVRQSTCMWGWRGISERSVSSLVHFGVWMEHNLIHGYTSMS